VLFSFQTGSDPSRADAADIDRGAYFQASSHVPGAVTAARLPAMDKIIFL